MNDRQARFAKMSDEELFATDSVLEDDFDVFKAEKAKRLAAREHERLRQANERAANILASKNAISYSETLVQEICERISCGELLICICEDEHMPTMRKVHQWMKGNPDFQMLYNKLVNDRLNVFEEEVIKIADDMANDFKIVIKNGKEKRVANPDMVARAKLRVEVRFRHLKAGRPQKWGKSTTLNVKNADRDDLSNIPTEELEKRIADIERKDRITRHAA